MLVQNHSFQAMFEKWHVEVDQQTDRFVAQPEICQQLCLMDWE